MISRFVGACRFLSNFYPVPIEFEGREYASVEHAYQAAKSHDPLERLSIEAAQSAGAAKRLGRRLTLRPDWEEMKLAVMEELLRQKFGAEPFRSQLLATGDQELIEGNGWGDRFWGVCRGSGLNHLGRLLMKVRAQLRSGDSEKGREAVKTTSAARGD